MGRFIKYRHRRNRPLHLLRYGWHHFTQHRDGIRHRHSRHRTKSEPSYQPRLTRMPRRVILRELRWQVIRGIGVAAGLLLLWAGAFGAWDIWKAKGDLTHAQNSATKLIAARDGLVSKYGRQLALLALSDMHQSAFAADSRLAGSAPLKVLSWVPGVNRQVNGLLDGAADVDVVSGEGEKLVKAASACADASHGNYIDLPTLKVLADQVRLSRDALKGRVRSADGLFGPIHKARVALNEQVAVVNGLLRDGTNALTFAQSFLGADGPRTYFVAGLNNSEMRDQGAVLSWSLLHVNHGVFTMSNASSVGTISLAQPAVPISDPGTKTVFGPLEPTRIWQSVNAVGDFPTSAKWMIAMYAAARGQRVDGVLGVDVVALQNILRVVGAVRIPSVNKNIDHTNVAKLILHDLYVKYPAGSQQWRHDEISSIAQAAVKKMEQGKFDSASLIKGLAQSTPGRHLLFYDTHAPLQALTARFNASGGLVDHGTNVMHLSVQSGVAAKVDWYMHQDVKYDIRISELGTAYITTTLTLTNTAPANAKPSYALGPDNTNTHIPGEYVARIYEWMPKGTTSPVAIQEGGLSLTRTVARVRPQQTHVAVVQGVLQHAVKNGSFQLRIIPQGTIHPATVTVSMTSANGLRGPGTVSFTGDKPVTLTWTSR